MIAEVKIPEVGESITEGYLVAWKKQDGEIVQVDDELFELETDKITLTVQAETGGKLQILVGEETTVQIGQVVANIDTDAAQPEKSAVKEEPENESAPPLSPEAGMDQANAKLSDSPDVSGLSPAVRSMIVENKLDPASISGTGKGGRITKEDVIHFLELPAPETIRQQQKTPPPSAVPAKPQVEETTATAPKVLKPSRTSAPLDRQVRKQMSPLRTRIAERLVESQQNAAILSTFNEVDMSNLMAMRARYKEAFEKKYGIRLGIMSFFVKAAVDALKTVPSVNNFIEGGEIIENNYYDIGVAVSTDRGLVVPVIRDADQLGFAEIEAAITDYAQRARDRKLTLDELQGGTFTISNGGVFGSLLSTPILNPPQSGILGMHSIKKRPVVVRPDDRIEVRPMMYLALSYDHRMIDGRESVTFLKRIVEVIENPERILLEI